MKKSILSLVLTMALLLGLFPLAGLETAAANESSRFTSVMKLEPSLDLSPPPELIPPDLLPLFPRYSYYKVTIQSFGKDLVAVEYRPINTDPLGMPIIITDEEIIFGGLYDKRTGAMVIPPDKYDYVGKFVDGMGI